MRKYLSFDANKNFFELTAVKVAFGTAGLLAGVSVLAIILNSNVVWRFDYQGLNHLLTVFKLPLGILATLIPVIALLAANHRSVQTKEQIRVTVSNNNFVNYFRHVEQFDKFIEARPGLKNYVSNKSTLHSFLFPNARLGDLAVGSEVEMLELGIIKMIDERAQKLKSVPHNQAIKILDEIQGIAEGHFGEIGLKVYSSSSKHSIPVPGAAGETLNLTDGDVARLFKEIGSTLSALMSFAGFDASFRPHSEINLAIYKLIGAPSLKLATNNSGDEFQYEIKLLD
ncbi:hypothetical protein J6I90_06555 [Pseudidiomarina sp. 1APP75-32.1]|uniref:Uncharacterized protein n=1 Tax=Pseudidiomarina terrestris TaxID=2820060 RepID=A0AAW7QWG2_9GAMM|nr:MULTISPECIES: hypothetical protein [unclassified Pseudidiomarina]MDN7124537.1 hypothetical protein [Pseudidiomarina sp. 1APP75-32.1]